MKKRMHIVVAAAFAMALVAAFALVGCSSGSNSVCRHKLRCSFRRSGRASDLRS